MGLVAYEGRDELHVMRQLVADMRWLADEPGTSEELWERIVSEYGSQYDGSLIGKDAREWLRAMAARLESHLGPKPVKG